MTDLLRGALAGTAATAAMSAVMAAAAAAGRMGRQPPEAIVRTAGATVGAEPHGDAARALGLAAHVGFGAGLGVLHTALPPRRGTAAVVQGTALSLAVYGASYLGWVPVVGALPRADRDRGDRQSAMVLAHLVFGGALGVLDARLRKGQVPQNVR